MQGLLIKTILILFSCIIVTSVTVRSNQRANKHAEKQITNRRLPIMIISMDSYILIMFGIHKMDF